MIKVWSYNESTILESALYNLGYNFRGTMDKLTTAVEHIGDSWVCLYMTHRGEICAFKAMFGEL